ncbi:MAG: small subunit ribosomal protein S11 [Parcubacteria group bacterium Gr01-1014_31]|nr:MAG: small subunit ribosomal protein S11 [Parcubacteria group bacterium Gr01-1014_31]
MIPETTTPQTKPETPAIAAPEALIAANEAASESKPVRAASGKKAKRQVPTGRAYIQATYNNTIVTFTDPQGNVIGQASAGRTGFRGPKKSTPYAAGMIVRQAATKAHEYGLREVSVFVKGFGSGREAAIRAINANGINVLSIKDVSPLPHNGCRPKKPRRI